MTKHQSINIFGTIAKAGTTPFVQAVAVDDDIYMIGQLGVGFYSAYPVSDTVLVTSNNSHDVQCIWESGAVGSSTVQ